MTVSIITIVYNNAKYIRDAIKSVLSQDYQSIEFIVIDGGSKDGTIEIIKEYQEQISYFLSESDNGIYDALNKGIAHSTGDVIGFLHSDDVFSNGAVISTLAREFSRLHSDVVYGDLDYVKQDATDCVVRHWESGTFLESKLKYGWMPPHPTFYARRDIYKKYGSFNLMYSISSDYDSMLRILTTKNIRVSYIPEVLVRMRVGGISNKNFINIINKSIEDYWVLRANKIGSFLTILCKNFRKLPQFFKN
jgi:glycosyltransferase